MLLQYLILQMKTRTCLAGLILLALLSGVIKDESIQSIIEDSKVLDSERQDLILNVCKGKLDEYGINFVKLLVENKRLVILPEISQFFEELKAEAEGVYRSRINYG